MTGNSIEMKPTADLDAAMIRLADHKRPHQ
jgi:hypothetical protein